jgi:phage terminase large subunit
MTSRLVEQHVNGYRDGPGISQLSGSEPYLATICDHDAEDRATLERWGIKTTKADKSIRPGIEAVQQRLRLDSDGRARLYFFRDALVEEDDTLKTRYKPVRTVEEFAGYAWPSFDGKRKEASPRDELPVKADDHGMDCIRYMCMHLSGKKKKKPVAVSYA